MRMDRRAGLLINSKIKLSELLAVASIVTSAFHSSSSSTSYASATVTGGTASPVWVISSTGAALAIAKVKSNTVTYLCTYNNYTFRSVAASGSNTVIQSQAGSYGVFLLVLRFPGFTEEEIDQCLAALSATRLAGKNSNSYGTVSVNQTSVTDSYYYFQAFVDAGGSGSICFSATKGTTRLFTNGSQTFWRLDSEKYYLSENGTTNYACLGGAIYGLTEA